MRAFTSTLIDRSEVARGTMAFTFERPDGFSFTAGQALTLTLADPPLSDEKGNERTFTIASPPQDTEHLQIATRMTGSAFKESLVRMDLGAQVTIEGPTGSFTLERDSEAPVVFVTGGIGITPFRSMIHDAIARGLRRPITLIASNRDPESAPFQDELTRLAGKHKTLTYIPTMTQTDASSWPGERRRVDAAFLRDHIGDLSGSVFYVAGPAGLVAGITRTLRKAGVKSSNVRSEEFPGYGSPEAQRDAKEPKGRLVHVASAGDLRPGTGAMVEVDGKEIALFNVDGKYYAIDHHCTHEGGPLAEGELEGTQVTCPWHGAMFDVTTGEVLNPPAVENVSRYDVKTDGVKILIAV